jgi:hypothetical protein
MLSRLLLTVLVLSSAQAFAQTPPPAAPASAGGAQPLVQPEAPADGRKNQRVERIRHEDGRVIIDELRYAGQTQSVKVQPKNGAPAYEVQPGGTRVWNMLNF